MVLLDTHALLWWTVDPDRLSPPARAACEAMEKTGGCASSISVWEIGVKLKRGQLELGTSLANYVGRLLQMEFFDLIAVDTATWMENLALAWEHRDPADRTIVATAKLRGIPIITKDKIIADFYRPTIW
jgi:PIN domain nuclease of toxin-antitoxin system